MEISGVLILETSKNPGWVLEVPWRKLLIPY
jgi:hypothetical protein